MYIKFLKNYYNVLNLLQVSPYDNNRHQEIKTNKYLSEYLAGFLEMNIRAKKSLTIRKDMVIPCKVTCFYSVYYHDFIPAI